MAELTVPQVDFSTIGNLRDTFNSARTEAIRNQTLANLGSGAIDYNTAARDLLKAGDFAGGLSLAKLGVQQTAAGNTANGVYGTPIYGTDAQGRTVLGAIAKNGTFKALDTNGVTVNPGIKVIDTPQGAYVVDGRSGRPVGGAAPQGQPGAVTGQPGATPPAQPASQPTGYYGKDYINTNADKAQGTDIGHARTALVSLQSKLPGLKTVVDELRDLSERATYTAGGQYYDAARRQFDLTPRDAAVARAKYISMVDNQILPLLRDTFGAQFTEREGNSLKATLGAPNLSPKEKQAVLDSFIQQKVRDVQALSAQANPPQAGASQSQAQPVRVNSPDEARRLPSGTPIILPDGTPGRVP